MIDVDVVNTLARAYKAGDVSSLETLHLELEPIIYAEVRRASVFGLPPSANIDDIRQESWVSLDRIARAWPGEGSFLAYFIVSQRRALRRWWMHEDGYAAGGARRRTFSVDHDEIVGKIDRHVVRDSSLLGPEQAAVLADILDVLPDGERQAVRLSAIDGYSFESIGAMIGVSRATAHREYVRGIARLRATIGAPS